MISFLSVIMCLRVISSWVSFVVSFIIASKVDLESQKILTSAEVSGMVGLL